MEYLYLKLADDLEREIRNGSYKAGQKLPSLRGMREQTGRSITTINQAYTELENRGIVNVREKSGFYVRPMLDNILPRPVKNNKIVRPHKVTINTMSTMIQQSICNPQMLPFGTALPSPDLLPLKQLAREVRGAATKYASGEYIGYCHPSGLKELRIEIGKRSVDYFDEAAGDEILITGGCMSAIDLSLRTVANPGDIILVESPTFLCYLQLIEDLNMRALEVPVDSDTGFDLEAVDQLLEEHDVRGALLNANFHNPLGYVMTREAKRKLVEMFSRRQIPIIEDDIYGDLFFDETRPLPLKAFDREGLVLYCSSFTKTLAPDLRVGWTIPGRFREKVKRLKFNSSVATSQLDQGIVASFMASGSYDRHLRKLRNALKKQAANLMLAIAHHFPEGTRVSAPRGGLCLWVELDQRIDALQLFGRAREENIALVPGSICSVTDNYRHCIRLNCGYPWTERSERGIATLAGIIRELLE